MIQQVKVHHAECQAKLYVVIRISYPMLSSQVMVFSQSVVPGIVHYVCGIYQLEQVHDNLLVIRKMFLSVAFSADNRQIVSGSRDKTIKLWNTVGQCKYTIVDDNHTDWVSCVRFSPNQKDPLIVSAGWDKLVKVWNLTNCKLRTNHYGHNSYINTVTVSPDGSLCASGGRDGKAMLWDLNDGKHLYTLESGDIINSLCFSPNRYWLCAASGSSIKIWDLETKTVADEVKSEKQCTSLAWSADGQTLFAGFTDNQIRVFEVQQR